MDIHDRILQVVCLPQSLEIQHGCGFSVHALAARHHTELEDTGSTSSSETVVEGLLRLDSSR